MADEPVAQGDGLGIVPTRMAQEDARHGRRRLVEGSSVDMLIKAQARVIRRPLGRAPLRSPLAGRRVNPVSPMSC